MRKQSAMQRWEEQQRLKLMSKKIASGALVSPLQIQLPTVANISSIVVERNLSSDLLHIFLKPVFQLYCAVADVSIGMVAVKSVLKTEKRLGEGGRRTSRGPSPLGTPNDSGDTSQVLLVA
eukprot:1958117-Rhodomonas_salina.1